MTGFDLTFLAVVLLSTGLGYLRGVVREVASLVVLLVAGVATYAFGDALTDILGGGTIGNLASYVVVFGVTFLIAAIVLEVLSHKLLPRGSRPVDRTLGAAFGLGRGWLVMGLVYLSLISYFDRNDPPPFMDGAMLVPLAAEAAEVIEGLGFDRFTFGSELGEQVGSGDTEVPEPR